jgi:hypothetical protein
MTRYDPHKWHQITNGQVPHSGEYVFGLVVDGKLKVEETFLVKYLEEDKNVNRIKG